MGLILSSPEPHAGRWDASARTAARGLCAILALGMQLTPPPASAQAPSFVPLPTPVTLIDNVALGTDVSASGDVVVYGPDAGNAVGFVWKESTNQATSLSDCPGPGDTTGTRGISGDGSLAVGISVCIASGGFEAIRSTDLDDSPDPVEGYPIARMGGLAGTPSNPSESEALATSFDGSVIVGKSRNATSDFEAFYWQRDLTDPLDPGSMLGLGFLSGDNTSVAYGVSANGGVTVGQSSLVVGSAQRAEATVWLIDAQGYVWPALGLGDLAHRADPASTDPVSSTAWATSADGSLIVGDSGSPNLPLGKREAFLWRADLPPSDPNRMIGLGGLAGGFESRALDASFLETSAGPLQVVVGRARVAGSHQAFLWTPDTGMLSLSVLLEALGVSGLAGWILAEASGLSVDLGTGLTISGYGINPAGKNQAWVVRGLTSLVATPEPTPALLLGGGLGALTLVRRRAALRLSGRVDTDSRADGKRK